MPPLALPVIVTALPAFTVDALRVELLVRDVTFTFIVFKSILLEFSKSNW